MECKFNKRDRSKSKRKTPLIEPEWNVNKDKIKPPAWLSVTFNRTRMECKYFSEFKAYKEENTFNRTRMECKFLTEKIEC